MTHTQILEVIASCSREVLPGLTEHDFQPADCLSDLGANSLDRAEIVVRVLEVLQLDVPRTALVRVANVGELAEALRQHLHAQ